MFSTGSLMRLGLVQIASEMNQEALSIHTGQWQQRIENVMTETFLNMT